MASPIIFCHYGNSEYLKYTLRCARHNNPRCEIFLLGDQYNKMIAKKLGISHVFFADLNYGDKIRIFDNLYRLIQGRLHEHIRNRHDWVKFVFKRWFFIFNFILRNGIQCFWHFDSDNMILENLATHEAKFRGCDCTDQCNGMCMNGYIAKQDVVKGYIDKINEIFQREEFLIEQQKEFDTIHPEFAFTEMRAYKIFKEEEGILSIRLNTIIDNSSFDDCICESHGMQMEETKFGKSIKKVFLNSDGRFYCLQQSSQNLIKMNSLNLSYVPLHFFDIVMHHSLRHYKNKVARDPRLLDSATLASALPSMKYRLRQQKGVLKYYLRNTGARIKYRFCHLVKKADKR